jgi:hypothetical protein
MTPGTDRFGRKIAVSTDKETGATTYTVNGEFSLTFEAGWPEHRALDTINAMAPEGYTGETEQPVTIDDLKEQLEDLSEQIDQFRADEGGK